MNFNLPDNQNFCVRLELGFPKVKQYIYHPIIQYFIFIRNFGCVKYKGRVYNLNKDQESGDMLYLLQEERFLEIISAIPNKNEVCRYIVKVLHPDYSFLETIQVIYLWGSLIDRYLPQLSDVEIIEFNLRAMCECHRPIPQ
jgi:hypothetical protein